MTHVNKKERNMVTYISLWFKNLFFKVSSNGILKNIYIIFQSKRIIIILIVIIGIIVVKFWGNNKNGGMTDTNSSIFTISGAFENIKISISNDEDRYIADIIQKIEFDLISGFYTDKVCGRSDIDCKSEEHEKLKTMIQNGFENLSAKDKPIDYESYKTFKRNFIEQHEIIKKDKNGIVKLGGIKVEYNKIRKIKKTIVSMEKSFLYYKNETKKISDELIKLKNGMILDINNAASKEQALGYKIYYNNKIKKVENNLYEVTSGMNNMINKNMEKFVIGDVFGKPFINYDTLKEMINDIEKINDSKISWKDSINRFKYFINRFKDNDHIILQVLLFGGITFLIIRSIPRSKKQKTMDKIHAKAFIKKRVEKRRIRIIGPKAKIIYKANRDGDSDEKNFFYFSKFIEKDSFSSKDIKNWLQEDVDNILIK